MVTSHKVLNVYSLGGIHTTGMPLFVSCIFAARAYYIVVNEQNVMLLNSASKQVVKCSSNVKRSIKY